MKLSAFSVNTIFVVLMLLGISLIPVLSLQLLPSSRSNDLSVSFSWDNAGPELLEMEVTTKLEGALARTRGLREIVSETGNGWGTIRLSIDKEENIDAIKLYLGSVVRSVKSGFPEGVQCRKYVEENTVPVKKLKKNGSFY
ncbi:MAG: efflux RND transporter permease subunit [Odoribacter splanchnicus]